MSFSTSTVSTFVFQQFHSNMYSRRLLSHNQLYQQQAAATPPLSSERDIGSEENEFDADVVMILSVLLCAVICLLGLNSILRCTLRCSRMVASESNASSSTTSANNGITKKALKTFPVVNYSAELKLPGLDAECVICLSEFTPNQRVKLLPTCNHGFHVRCIDRWLTSNSSCPICRNCLIQTCQKIVGCSIPNTSPPTPVHQESIYIIVPSPEVNEVVHSYQT
ncbi:RING-type E3 ubiquitin transferase [Heracleum sosnowskyi]|uniref:RING-type E3 ubiquitin transferase n=1 Tax=Heracleum sosnowskyi TaxID=360622 RepID=A0AAD8NCA5_9APIA|nr:RING-type E3 ubiquitin transferase [Heracleum sosnowskyi]KAK1403889.1 RING-type E3 ubiquitin transferase [Heracleum sosnowskyi]